MFFLFVFFFVGVRLAFPDVWTVTASSSADIPEGGAG
jgi:hypothetical protein